VFGGAVIVMTASNLCALKVKFTAFEGALRSFHFDM
jgi:hypothetical protein